MNVEDKETESLLTVGVEGCHEDVTDPQGRGQGYPTGGGTNTIAWYRGSTYDDKVTR